MSGLLRLGCCVLRDMGKGSPFCSLEEQALVKRALVIFTNLSGPFSVLTQVQIGLHAPWSGEGPDVWLPDSA